MRPFKALFITAKESDNPILKSYRKGICENSAACFSLTNADYLSLGKRGFEARALQIIADHQIDYIFINTDKTLDPRFVQRLSNRAFTVLICLDTEYLFEPHDRYYAQTVDLVLLPDYLSQFKFELIGIPATCTFSLFDSQLYKKLDDIKRDLDVSFVGITAPEYGHRRAYLKAIEQAGTQCETFGWGSTKGRVDFSEMVRTFNRSKINLNFTELFRPKLTELINMRMRQSKGRPIEVALSGGFVLSQYAPGIEHMFEIGKEIDVFHTKAEMLEKIRYYLAHEEEREAIAKRAHERALREYDCVRGFERVFNALRERQHSRPEKTLYLDPIFLHAYGAHHLELAINFALRGAFRKAREEMADLALRPLFFLRALGSALRNSAKTTIRTIAKRVRAPDLLIRKRQD